MSFLKNLFVKKDNTVEEDGTLYVIEELLPKKQERLILLQEVIKNINERVAVLSSCRTQFRKLQQSYDVKLRESKSKYEKALKEGQAESTIKKKKSAYATAYKKEYFYTQLSAQVSSLSDQLKSLVSGLERQIARLEIEIEEAENLLANPERKTDYYKKVNKITSFFEMNELHDERVGQQNKILDEYNAIPEFEFDPEKEKEYIKEFELTESQISEMYD